MGMVSAVTPHDLQGDLETKGRPSGCIRRVHMCAVHPFTHGRHPQQGTQEELLSQAGRVLFCCGWVPMWGGTRVWARLGWPTTGRVSVYLAA